IRDHVDPDPDAVQERGAHLAPGRRRPQAEAGAVDHHDGVTASPSPGFFSKRLAERPAVCVIRSRLFESCAMTLALHPPFPPMEAQSVDAIPIGPEWQYEPKWDGFRCLVFRDGDKVELQSKSGQSLTRYFPEIVAAVGKLEASALVLDGEIVVPADGAFSFDALLQRIHPAASRIKRLADETPALLIVFDLLDGTEGPPLTGRSLT